MAAKKRPRHELTMMPDKGGVFSMRMHVSWPFSVVLQSKPLLQLTEGVEVGTQDVPVVPASVVVIHHVTEIILVVKQIRADSAVV